MAASRAAALLRHARAPSALLRRGRGYSTAREHAAAYEVAHVPTIDLGPLQHLRAGEEPPHSLIEDIAQACEQWGFFQVVNHGVDPALRARAEEQQRHFFALPESAKDAIRRSAGNARGWYNDELTKQRRDWKEGFDFGTTPATEPAWPLADDDAAHANLDGFNRFPPAALAPEFRSSIVEYYEALTGVAEGLTRLFSLGLGMPADYFEPLLNPRVHTSYLRLNYYAPYTGPDATQLCISPHKDAGFLTVLAQDPSCHSLQVRDRSKPDEWVTVVPEHDAFTINTGDMAQIFSNNRYFAPEHRVLTSPSKARYSAPFFYNPAYAAAVKPLPSLGRPQYDELRWGYFRAIRFAGDFADYGTEIQISDFAAGVRSWHVENQERFMQEVDFNRSFDVEEMRPLLQRSSA